MKQYLTLFQIFISAALIVAILFQVPGEGWAKIGGGEFYRSKRGIEKLIFYLTIGLSILFLISSILNLIA